MANVQTVMLSGRYRTEALASHWSETGSKFCQTPHCKDQNLVEDLTHILAICGALDQTRSKLRDFTKKYCSKIESPDIKQIVEEYCTMNHPQFCQFLVDCSVLPLVITAVQVFGEKTVHEDLFRITRTWCYTLHRDRLKILGRWKHY